MGETIADFTEPTGAHSASADPKWSVYEGKAPQLDIVVRFMQANIFMAPEVQVRRLAETGVDPAVIQEAYKVVYDLK